jgi:hypothetical protein
MVAVVIEYKETTLGLFSDMLSKGLDQIVIRRELSKPDCWRQRMGGPI